MTKTVFAAALAGASLLAAPTAAQDNRDDRPMTKGEERLARILEGRVAGEPQSCLRDRNARSIARIDGTALVYKSGRTIWVNVPRNAEAVDDSDVLVVRKFGSSALCRYDTITLRDRFNGFYTGNLFLGDFVPYRLPEDAG